MKDLPFLDHLEILRRKLISVILSFFLFFIFFFFAGQQLLGILTSPLSDIPVSLVYLKLQEKILAYLNASLLAGIILTFPVLVLQSAHFIYPALKKEEKVSFFLVTLFILILFFTGIAFAYFILLPFACGFFYSFSAGDGIEPLWSIGSYVDLASSMILVTGCIFQSPLPVLFMINTGIISTETLRRYRRHIIIIVFIISAFLTPPDIYTQAAAGTVLYLLFELTLAVSVFLARGSRNK